jgi:RHS repeat-associated protein
MDEELNELHVMDDQTRVAMLRTGYDDGTPFTKYILSDHLGSSNVILETSGAVYNREEFYPFGETSFGAFGKKRYRYVGKEKDEESGLYYYGARYFQPWSCRFISVDPLAGKYAQLTPYNYADNTPVTDKDIDGKQTQSSDISAKSNTTSSTPTAQSTPTLIINTNQIKVLETKTAVVNYLYSQIKQGVFNLVPCPAPNMSEMEIKKTLNTLVNVDSKNPNVAFVILSDEKIFQIQVQQGVETVKDETKDYIKDKAIDKTKDLVTKAIVKSTLNYRFDTKTVAKEELIKSFGAERALKAINISSKIFKTLSVAMKEIGRFKVEAFYKVLSSGTPEYSHERFEMAVLTVLNQWAIEQSTKNQPADYKSLKLPFVPMQQDEYLRAPK